MPCSEEAQRNQLQLTLDAASNDVLQLRRERKRMDEKMAHIQG